MAECDIIAEPGKQDVGYVVVGGGIAGVSCAEQLSASCPDQKITLITASPLIRAVTNFQQVSKVIELFDVEERPASSLQSRCKNVHVLHSSFVNGLNIPYGYLSLEDGLKIPYSKLCLCTGGTPKKIAKDNPYVLGIRDTESVVEFQKRMAGARRVAVVGNGGIATELVYEMEGCEVLWAIKDSAISSTFVDAGAAEFLLPRLNAEKDKSKGALKRHKYTVTKSVKGDAKAQGGALGPDWSAGLRMEGKVQGSHHVHVEYTCEVESILTPEKMAASGRPPDQFPTTSSGCGGESTDWPVYIALTNGKLYGCDFVISATGVIPNTKIPRLAANFEIAEDGGLKVNAHMQTKFPDVYAAGDVCSASWEPSPHWLQMRLWSQARQMGAYAAKCMIADTNRKTIPQDFCFELFAHVTKFFGYKVVLLGKYNAQGLGSNFEYLLRMTEGTEYIKVVMKDGRMQGAVLIGETDLEETFENLILNAMDLSVYGEDLLDPGIDIEDYFD